MTVQERDVLMPAVPHGARLAWAPEPDPRLVRLLTPQGCLLLARDADGQAVCTVHAVRPYQCRRFMCGRDSCDEPVEIAAVPAKVLQSRDLRRQYARNQNRAQVWALDHGWTRDMR